MIYGQCGKEIEETPPLSGAVKALGVVLILVAIVTFFVANILTLSAVSDEIHQLTNVVAMSLRVLRALLLMLLAALGFIFTTKAMLSRHDAGRFRIDSVGDLIAGLGLLAEATFKFLSDYLVHMIYNAAQTLLGFSSILVVIQTVRALVPAAFYIVAVVFYLRASGSESHIGGAFRGVTVVSAIVLLAMVALTLCDFALPAFLGAPFTSSAAFTGLLNILRTVHHALAMLFLVLRGAYWLVAPSVAKRHALR
jgi:hypothetical protein